MHTVSSGSEHTLSHTALVNSRGNSGPVQPSTLSSCAPQAQSSLSSAVGLTMPQPTQNSLLHILLLWTTTLSVVQAIFIILFFTVGQRDLSQINSAVALQSQANNTPSPPTSDHKAPFGLMITYQVNTDNDSIKWKAKTQTESLISETGKDLQIYEDGYYFLNLQVTLKKCPTKLCKVSVKSSNAVIMQGWINTSTCSTGPLGKVEVLSATDTLEFTMADISANDVDDTEYLTYLNIIYMSKH